MSKTRRQVVKSFVISWGVFTAIAFWMTGFRSFLVALLAMFLPISMAVTEWPVNSQVALAMTVLSVTLVGLIILSILYFQSRVLFVMAHLTLILYWIVCFGLLGIAIT